MAINVSVSTSNVEQYPLTYAQIETAPGFYEPQGRKDVLLFVTQPNKSTGKQAVIRFSNEGKNIAYPANGWNGYRFRQVSGNVTLSA